MTSLAEFRQKLGLPSPLQRPPDPANDEAPAGPAAGASEATTTKGDEQETTAVAAVQTHGQVAVPFAAYAEHGWFLCALEPNSKRATEAGWPTKRVAKTVAKRALQGKLAGAGLLHGLSSTCAVDIDDMAGAASWLADRGIDAQGLLNDPCAVRIHSGRPNRAKLLYRLPAGVRLGTHKVAGGALELRCDGAQDVLPPSIHPDTGQPYEWIYGEPLAGSWEQLPELPGELLDAWRSLEREPAASAPLRRGVDVHLLRLHLAAVRKSARDEYEDWMRVGMALHHETDGGAEGLELWDEWSAESPKYVDSADLARRWEGFGKRTDGPLATLSTLEGMADPSDPECEAARHAANAAGFDDVSEPGAAPTRHPWTQFVQLRAVPQAPRFVIPWFIQEGVVVIAGAPGVGKTTTLLPLALTAAGLHREGDPLAPEHWRHICYLTEAPEQVEQLLAAASRRPELGASFDQIAERIHVVPLHRMAPTEAVKAGGFFAASFTRRVDEAVIPPLVVIDTQAAALALENENANSEVSAAVAAFKQRFAGLPVWFVSHTAKTQWENSDAKALTARGGGAWGGDAHQLLFVVEDCGRSYLRRSKTRFEARWPELEITTEVVSVPMLHVDGTETEHPVRWASLAPVGAAQGAADRKDDTMRIALGLVSLEQEAGNPVSTAEGGDGHAGRKLRAMDKTLERMKAGAVRELLVEAEGRGLLTQVPRPTAGGRTGTAWELTEAGRTWLETL